MRIQSTSGAACTSAVKQLRQPILHPQVVTVIGGILGDQDDLVHAHLLQRAGLGQDRRRRAADRRALDQRDGAEGARAAAAIGDLEVGAGALHRRPQGLALVGADGRGGGQVVERLRVCALAQTLHHLDNIHPAPRAQDAVDARHLAAHLGAVALRQAAGGDQDLPLALVGCQLRQHAAAIPLLPGR